MNGKKEEMVLWALPARKLFEHFKSSENGLGDSEAEKRLAVYGENEIAEKEKRHGGLIFLSQFKSPLIIVLIVAAIVAYFLGEEIDSIVILAIVMVSTILGFFQEYRAEKALRELRKYVLLKARVLRSGKIIELDSRYLVPGDIVHIEAGDIIPADKAS